VFCAFSCAYRDKKVVGVFMRFRAPLHLFKTAANCVLGAMDQSNPFNFFLTVG
jgi:hypothetical protein